MGISIVEKSKERWLDVSRKVNKAVVFIDNTLAECLHWNGGAMLFYQAGAVDVREFSSFESGTPDQHKAVFLVSTALLGTTRQILQDILQASEFYYTIVISSLSPAVHSLLRHGTADNELLVFHDIEDALLDWMGNKSYTSEVEYQPLGTAPIHSQLMLLPEHNDLFPLMSGDIKELQLLFQSEAKGNQTEVGISHVPDHFALKLKLLVCCLNSWLEQLCVTEDVYCLGNTSKMVAAELASVSWAKTRRKNSPSKVSLVLVDRTLDIASAIGHHMETMMDRAVSLLSKLPGHHNDISVNMEAICAAHNNIAKPVIAPGCLAHPSDETATELLHSFCMAKQKEALMEINRHIVEAAMQEKLLQKLSVKPRISADQLENHVALFKGHNPLIRKHCGVLQLVMATIQILRSANYSRQDSLLGVEKGLLQALEEEGGMSPLVQLNHTLNRELAKNQEERLYTLEDMFLLLLYIYSLAENSSLNQEQEERILQGTLLTALKNEKLNEWPQFLKNILGDDGYMGDESVSGNDIDSILDGVFEKLRALGDVREGFQKYWSVYESGGMMSQATVKPLLKQIVEDVCDPAKPEMTDLEYKSTGFRQLLKSGFGLFMNVAKPRPSDHPTLIIFVLGGVTSTEVRQVQEAVTAAKSDLQVIVGSTCLLKPTDLLHNVLVKESLINPDET